MSKGVPIGLTNLVYAIMTEDIPATTVGGTDGHTTYDESVRLLGAISATFSPNASNDTLFADDGPFETASTLGAMTLELNVADIPAQNRAELLGARYDETTGGLIHSASDVPPYVAVGMSVLKSNGASRLIWYMKGKFTIPDDNNQTKADSINWNTATISGNFLKRDSDGIFRVAVDTDDQNVKPFIKDNWFTSPNILFMDAVGKITATPATGATIVAGTDTITLNCETSSATLEYRKNGDADWTAYDGPIDTTGWSGNVLLTVKAAKSGLVPNSAIFTYTVETDGD